MISIEHLHKRYATVHAVNDLSLNAREGEIFGLLGPNGAGKSTTIRMMVNILQPDSGTIQYDGEAFNDATRDRIGYLSEERGLYQKARILETIQYFAGLRGVDATVAKERAMRWLKRFDLGGSEKRRIEELSKGNQQKLQIVIALIHEPKYIILDEPSSGLDPINQELLREIVEEFRAKGCTVLYSTHMMDIAERMCDRIALINKGRVVLSGTIGEVRAAHGRNVVRVEFNGDGSVLGSLAPVQGINVYPNFAELQLRDGSTVNDLFPHLGSLNLQISRIESVRPSLNTIFIQTVGSDTEVAQ